MIFFNRLIKWVLVITAGLSAALLAIIFLSSSPSLKQFLLRLVILLAIGFMGGLAGRVLFSKFNTILTFLMVLVANLVSLLFIDLFYETPYQLDIIAGNFDYQAFSISDGAQILSMSLVSLIPVLFMHRKVQKAPATRAHKSNKTRKQLSESLKPVMHKINPVNWQVLNPKPKKKSRKNTNTSRQSVAAKPKSSAKTKVKKPSGSTSTVTVSRPASRSTSTAKIKPSNGRKPVEAKIPAKKLKLPAKQLRGGSNDVKLVGEEEHVCPYCLEEVVKGDRAGVVICPECGTWHHQDCWNLTGSCGVAHRNEL